VNIHKIYVLPVIQTVVISSLRPVEITEIVVNVAKKLKVEANLSDVSIAIGFHPKSVSKMA